MKSGKVSYVRIKLENNKSLSDNFLICIQMEGKIATIKNFYLSLRACDTLP